MTMSTNKPAPDERVLITSRAEFQAALRRALATVAAQGGRELLLCDEDFTEWPLNDREVLDQLTRWARPHRRLVIVARQFDDVVRRHPRFVEWRRLWSHVVEGMSPDAQSRDPLPAMLLAPNVALVRLVEARVHRGIASTDAADHLQAREQFDAITQRALPSFRPTFWVCKEVPLLADILAG